MPLQLTNDQLLSARNLMNNLKKFVQKGFGTVSNVLILTNKATPNVIYIKYETTSTTGGEMDYQNRIASIDQSGRIDFIESKFKDIFEKAAFIADCKNLNLDDENSYEIV